MVGRLRGRGKRRERQRGQRRRLCMWWWGKYRGRVCWACWVKCIERERKRGSESKTHQQLSYVAILIQFTYTGVVHTGTIISSFFFYIGCTSFIQVFHVHVTVGTSTNWRTLCILFVRRARVLPSPCPATRNLSFLRFHRHRHLVVSIRCSLEWYGLM